MAIVLSIDNLSKKYGSLKAVDSLSLQVEEGSIYGLLGPNGSGKTTTLGMVLDVIQPTGGSFSWFGDGISKATKQRVGAILETPNFYPYLTAKRNLQVIADTKGADHQNIAKMLDLVGLGTRSNTTFKGFSLGMKQRLALAAAMLNDPEVLVLDEPTNGLDPQGIAEVRDLILRIAAQGKTIILASHLLDEVEKVCTHVAVLRTGKLVTDGPVGNILSAKEQLIVSAEYLAPVLQLLERLPYIAQFAQEKDYVILTLQEGYSSTDLNRDMFAQGVVLSQLVARRKSLEKQFLEIIKS
ncbi:ATP-binding cassette domain-containing protein [Pontibacter sp. BT310]|uniref:ATP-binding cassette domain-containing protein n=1 Tax=Pontibacter populi TaxID=890055 RepID=A0ABS6XDC8_9BACT|nr:ATP-binding cassette domain-containing protein [Pontibacter populi]MBJ6118654.1 ATP-binding cassette domain-containing protein [Pontibacter sp. BT310]MBR0571083.1 ATP-binding cassette domain-containing protein [Microvirga sp. STS03]MBW3365508.1 ATP-binding cassette domain-containing protein [Pontibacter populi]